MRRSEKKEDPVLGRREKKKKGPAISELGIEGKKGGGKHGGVAAGQNILPYAFEYRSFFSLRNLRLPGGCFHLKMKKFKVVVQIDRPVEKLPTAATDCHRLRPFRRAD